MDYVLIIALLTWGGVLFYLFRLEKLTRSVEAEVQRLSSQVENREKTSV